MTKNHVQVLSRIAWVFLLIFGYLAEKKWENDDEKPCFHGLIFFLTGTIRFSGT